MKIRFLLPCLLLLATLFLQVKAHEDFEGNYTDYSSNYSHEEMHEDSIHEHPVPSEGWSEEDISNFNDEEFDEEDWDMPEPQDYERILAIVKKIEEVYLALSAELEEYHNRNLSKVVDKLDSCVDIFSEAMGEDQEKLPTSCEDGIRWGFKIFSRAISLLEQRKCDSVNITRRCIPAEIADKYIPQLKELYTELEEEVLSDEDEDGVPDVCKYWEEWEDEDHPEE